MTDVADMIECEISKLDCARTVLEAASNDLSCAITVDKKDNDQLKTFIKRRENAIIFVDIALDYLDKTREKLQSVIDQVYEESRGGGIT